MFWSWSLCPEKAKGGCTARGACLSLLLLSLLTVSLHAQRGATASDVKGSTATAYAQAQALLREGRLAEADVVLNQALLLEPENLKLISLAGKVSASIGHQAEAVRLLGKAASLAPRQAEAHYDLSIALASEPDLPAALGEATKAVALAPASAAMHRNRGKVLAGLDQTSDAVLEYERALALDPNDAKALYDLALLKEKQNEPAAEAALLERLTRLEPGDAVAFYMLGQCRFRLGDEGAAVAAWRRALALKPDYRGPLYRLAQARKRTDPEESAALMRRFTAAQQKDDSLDQVRALGNRGYHAMQSAEWQSAISYFRSAIALCDTCLLLGDLEKNLGLAECHDNELDAGERDLRAALQLKPADPDIAQAIQAVVAQRASAR